MDDSQIKTEPSAERKAVGYKSWKKKYRKMRIIFDQKMQTGEDLHKQEAKTASTVKRLAVENDRLLDILIEINNCAQIPLNKRIDVAIQPKGDAKTPILAMDREHAPAKAAALKKLEEMLAAVPHVSYAAAKSTGSRIIDDLTVAEGESHPASFLTADDVDDYIFAVDSSLDGGEAALPTLAPRAHPNSHLSSHPHLKNPTSVTNWLRKHAPKIFLQDGETHHDDNSNTPAAAGEGAGGGAAGADAVSQREGGHGAAASGGRKSRGSGARGERGSKSATSSSRGKRNSGAAASRASTFAAAAATSSSKGGADNANANNIASADASMDEDADYGTPVGRGKRKRNADAGYRPGGSASRPAKKKRRSDADGGSARRSKKETAAAAAAAEAAD